MHFKRLFVFLLLVALKVPGQTFNVLHRSGFSHQYVVQRPLYAEHPADTVSGRYMATFQLQCKAHPIAVAAMGELLKIKTREENANAFYLLSATEKDSTLNLLVRCYFLFEKAYNHTESSKIKSHLFLFGCLRWQGFYQTYYFNDSLRYLHLPECVGIPLVSGRHYTVKPCNSSGLTQAPVLPAYGNVVFSLKGPLRIKAGPGKKAVFVGLFDYNPFTRQQTMEKPVGHVMQCGSIELDYQHGRLMLEVGRLAGWWKIQGLNPGSF